VQNAFPFQGSSTATALRWVYRNSVVRKSALLYHVLRFPRACVMYHNMFAVEYWIAGCSVVQKLPRWWTVKHVRQKWNCDSRYSTTITNWQLWVLFLSELNLALFFVRNATLAMKDCLCLVEIGEMVPQWSSFSGHWIVQLSRVLQTFVSEGHITFRQQFEGRSPWVMWLFRDMLHSIKLTSFS